MHAERLQQETSNIYGTASQAREALETNPTPQEGTNKLEQLAEQALELHNAGEEVALDVQRLEKRLNEGQAALGNLMTESWNIQNAIKNRREQNKRDQQELERARASAVQQRARLGEFLENIRDISRE